MCGALGSPPDPPTQDSGADAQTAHQQPSTQKFPVVPSQVFEPSARIDMVSHQAWRYFFSSLDSSMAFVVIPFAGLKPLTHGENVEVGMPDCPCPCPAILQAPSFVAKFFECVSYGVWTCTSPKLLMRHRRVMNQIAHHKGFDISLRLCCQLLHAQWC